MTGNKLEAVKEQILIILLGDTGVVAATVFWRRAYFFVYGALRWSDI